MQRTRQEIREIAKGIFNRMFAELLQEFPNVEKAWMQSAEKRRNEYLTEQEDLVEQILLNKFGSSD